MKRVLSIAAVVATAATAIAFAMTSKSAPAPAPRPGGSAGNCNPTVASCNDPHNTRIIRNGITYDLAFNGGMWIECLDTGTTATGHWLKKQMVIGFRGSVTDPTWGTISIYLDSSRTQDTSMMVANLVGQMYPAKHDVYAFARVEMSSEPGVVYRTKNRFHMYNNAITSFAVPGQPQPYDVAQDVEFENIANPGPVVFTMVATPMTVYPN